MAQVLVRDVDPKTLDVLKRRAREHHRSLQAELRVILEQAARTVADTRALATRLRRELGGKRHSDSATLVAEDRAR